MGTVAGETVTYRRVRVGLRNFARCVELVFAAAMRDSMNEEKEGVRVEPSRASPRVTGCAILGHVGQRCRRCCEKGEIYTERFPARTTRKCDGMSEESVGRHVKPGGIQTVVC